MVQSRTNRRAVLKQQSSELLRAIMIVRTLVDMRSQAEAARDLVDENLVKAIQLAGDIRTTLWSHDPIDQKGGA